MDPTSALRCQFDRLIADVKVNVTRTVTDSVCREIDAHAGSLFQLFLEQFNRSLASCQSTLMQSQPPQLQQQFIQQNIASYLHQTTVPEPAARTVTQVNESRQQQQFPRPQPQLQPPPAPVIKSEPSDESVVVEEFIYTEKLFTQGDNHSADHRGLNRKLNTTENRQPKSTGPKKHKNSHNHQLHHNAPGQKPKTNQITANHPVVLLPCTQPGCPQSFTLLSQLEEHLATAHTFFSPDHTTTTTTTASNTNPFQRHACEYPGCDKAFSQKDKLRRHEMIHSGVRPFRCKWPGCEHRSARRDHLVSHIKSIHCGLTRSKASSGGTKDDRDYYQFIDVDYQHLKEPGQVPF